MDGCLGGVKSGKGLGCVVNPEVGKDTNITKTEHVKKYAVIGAGLSGLEASIRLKEKGHLVDLYENNEIGGQFKLAYLPPKKEKLKSIIDYYKQMLEYHNITIYKKEINKDYLLKKNYDGIILATGSKPFIPIIKGLKKYHWAEILLKSNKIKNKNVLIIGGGLIGLETAHALINDNNHVTIVEMLSELANNMEMISKKLTLKALKDSKKATIYTSTKVTEINQNEIKLDNGLILNNIDEIVVSTGMKPYRYLEKELLGLVSIYLVGDANIVGNAQSAIEEGYNIALKLS
jgi:pyruvate/2-oxoglutarate dehydrogenase complex dihydrolipoamide dehydrogenase (E3) component